jgi:hypothetical protein
MTEPRDLEPGKIYPLDINAPREVFPKAMYPFCVSNALADGLPTCTR